MNSYKELIVWQKAMDLIVEVYHATGDYPKEEKFGLSSQMRRAVVSIPSNIAEGFGRKTTVDFIHFLHIARGSLYEFQTQAEASMRLSYLSDQNCTQLIEKSVEIEKLLNGLIHSLKNKINNQ
ncbi:MAG: four helix bundle protein [Bacteroidales bacterium]